MHNIQLKIIWHDKRRDHVTKNQELTQILETD